MAKFLVSIEWAYSSDLVFLDFDALAKGDSVMTEELWDDGRPR